MPALRLAPLALLLVVVYVAAFSVVAAAKSSIPGDPAFPLKQWMREQRVQLADGEQFKDAVVVAENEIAAEMKELAARQIARQAVHQTNGQEPAMELTQQFLYRGQSGDLLDVGPLLVAPNFQPDANSEQMAPMAIEGDLAPGVLVEIHVSNLAWQPLRGPRRLGACFG